MLGNVQVLQEKAKVKNTNNFGAELKRARAVMRITQLGLANRVGVSLSTIRAWEQNYQLPRFDTWERLCRVIKAYGDFDGLIEIYENKKGQ